MKYLLIAALFVLAACNCKVPPQKPAEKKITQESNKHDLPPSIHHYMGIELNMQTWNLLEKKDRTQQDTQRMLSYAFASNYHWYKSPQWQPVNAQRGEWLISHAFAFANMGEKALEHARNCHKITEEQNLQDFDLAYSYEALARAYAILGNKEEYQKYFDLATQAGANIADSESKGIFESDLKSGPWLTQ